MTNVATPLVQLPLRMRREYAVRHTLVHGFGL